MDRRTLGAMQAGCTCPTEGNNFEIAVLSCPVHSDRSAHLTALNQSARTREVPVRYLSCGAFALYSTGVPFEPPVAVELFQNALQRPAQSVPLFEVYKDECIARDGCAQVVTGNDSWRNEIHDVYRSGQGPCTSSICSLLSDVFANNGALYFGGSPETVMLYEMHRPNDRNAKAVNLGINLRSSTPFGCQFAYFYFGSAGSANYGHWLVDDLPCFKSIDMYRALKGSGEVAIVLTSHGEAIDRVRLQSIQSHPRVGDIPVFFLDPAVNYHFERLYFTSPVSYHPASKLRAALTYVRDAYTRNMEGSGGIFVTRSRSSGRRIDNVEAVEAWARDTGLAIVDCETLSFADQVAIFAGAHTAIGVMGAAMTNCLFMSRGASQIHLACEGWREPFYWDLAEGCGHRYTAVFGAPLEGGAPYNVPFFIDIDALDSAFRGTK